MNCDTCSSTACTDCSVGYYIASTLCSACSSNCDECTDNTICTQCAATFFLYKDKCEKPCPAKTYPATTTCEGTCFKYFWEKKIILK